MPSFSKFFHPPTSRFFGSSALVLLSSLALAGCAATAEPPPQQFVQATEVPPPEPEAEDVETIHEEKLKERKEGQAILQENMKEGVDDYRYQSGMTALSSEPGWKSRRALEIEKIHRLAKLCIQANNVSPPCLEIVRLNIRAGKFFILQETMGYDAETNKMRR